MHLVRDNVGWGILVVGMEIKEIYGLVYEKFVDEFMINLWIIS